MKFSKCIQPLLLAILSSSATAKLHEGSAPVDATAGIVSETKVIKETNNGRDIGLIRYHYDSSIGSCSHVAILGVGTFMFVQAYDKIAAALTTGKPMVVVIADHNMNNFRKTDAAEYATLANNIKHRLQEIIPMCDDDIMDPRSERLPKFVIGGHSASGQASIGAWQQGLFDFEPIAYVGLDPYEISSEHINETMPLNLPAVHWGFSKTTCLVKTDKAAAAAYELTVDSARVLYQIHNNEDGCAMTHCAFTDDGCGVKPVICSTEAEYDWIYEHVATSVHRLVDVVGHHGSIRKADFQLEKCL